MPSPSPEPMPSPSPEPVPSSPPEPESPGGGHGGWSGPPATPEPAAPAAETEGNQAILHGKQNGETAAAVLDAATAQALLALEADPLTVAVATGPETDFVTLSLPASFARALSGTQRVEVAIAHPTVRLILSGEVMEQWAARGGVLTLTVERRGDTVFVRFLADGQGVEIDSGITMVLPAEGEDTTAVRLGPDGNEYIVKKSVAQAGSIAVELEGSGAIRLDKRPVPFSDAADHWAAGDIALMSSRAIFFGTQAGQFLPEHGMDRAMLAAVLYRLEDTPAGGMVSFPDVSAAAWYSPAVSWAAKLGLVAGTGSGFDPEGALTQEQLVTILYRYAAQNGFDVSAAGAPMPDPEVSEWAVQAMAWATQWDLLPPQMTGGPKDAVTRAEAACVLARLLRRISFSA